MSLEWNSYTIGESCELITGFPFKSKYYLDDGVYKVVRGDNVKEGFIKWDDKKRCWNELNDKLKRVILKEGDIVIGMDGSKLGKNRATVSKKDLPALLAQRVACVRAKEGFDQNYIKYVILSNYFKAYVDKVKTGTSIPHISLGQISEFTFDAPNYEKQKIISNILSNLDKKINVNQEINKNLDNQISSLFNHLFLRVLYAIENDNQNIPNNWEFKKLSEFVVKSNTGADAIKKAPIVDFNTGIKCIRTGDLSNNRPFEKWGYTNISKENFIKYKLCKGDIIVARTGSASLGLNKFIIEDLDAVYNNGLIRLKIDYSKISPLFLYGYLNSYIYKKYIEAINIETSTRPNMKINYLVNFKMLCPPHDIQQEFDKISRNMFLLKNKLEKEIIILNNLRDTLLPKLMSGEIDASKINCDL